MPGPPPGPPGPPGGGGGGGAAWAIRMPAEPPAIASAAAAARTDFRMEVSFISPGNGDDPKMGRARAGFAAGARRSETECNTTLPPRAKIAYHPGMETT